MNLSRRSFLKSSAATTAAIAASPGIVRSSQDPSAPGNKWPGRVVINFNKNAIKGSPPTPTINDVDDTVVAKMVDDTIKLLTGEATVGAAWKAIFPSSLTAQSKIAIKVYSASPQTSSSWQAVKAITDGLQQMDVNGATFPAGNISIYEGNASNRHTEAGFTTANFPGIKIEYWGRSQFSDGTGNEAAGAIKNRAYAPALKNADFLINAFNLHGHGAEFGSFSLGFKNHFGTYELFTPSDLHYTSNSNRSQLCQQGLRDMNCTGPIFKKTVLNACIGIVGNNEGVGPLARPDDFSTYVKTMNSTCKNPSTIIMSTDAISCEMQAIKITRLNKLPAGGYKKEDMPPYLQASAGISGALSGTTYNIGVIDESKMDIRRINNDITEIRSPANHHTARSKPAITASALPGRAGTFIEYRLPPASIGKKAVISIFTLQGALVREQEMVIPGQISHYAWDNRDQRRKTVQSGRYVVRLLAGRVNISTSFTIR